MRQYLSITGFTSRFENIPQIIGLLTRRKPLRFTDEQKQSMEHIFRLIQQPFNRHRGDRKNFLSYAFVIYKFCELLELRQFLPLLPLLKPANRAEADKIWELICKDCGFEYCPTP